MQKTRRATSLSKPHLPLPKGWGAGVFFSCLLLFAHPAAGAAISTAGAVPGYEHIRFESLTFDLERRELRFVLENTTPQDLQFSATLFFFDRTGATVFRPRIQEFLRGSGRTPCRIPLPSGKKAESFRDLEDLRWDVARKNRVLVEVRPVVSVARGACGEGFSWERLRFFGSDYGYEIRGKILCPRGKTSWSRGIFRLRLENVAHEALLEKDVVLKDLRPGGEREFLLRGAEMTLRELRSLAIYRLLLIEILP